MARTMSEWEDFLSGAHDISAVNLPLFLREAEAAPSREREVALRGFLREWWSKLQELPMELKAEELRVWKRNRGLELERLLFVLFALEKLRPSAAYRRRGEQIDGMFELEGRHFLVEVKWEDHETPASEIFAFRGKIEGKLAGTLGVFVSVGRGFSKDAPGAVSWGKDLNVLLVDRRDVDFAVRHERGFCEVMRVKLRAAAQRGLVYFSYARYLDEQEALGQPVMREGRSL